MNVVWQLQEAKNRLSQVVNDASSNGPQIITVHGKPVAIVLSMQEYERLIHPQTTLTEFFAASPFYDVDLDVVRDSDYTHEADW